MRHKPLLIVAFTLIFNSLSVAQTFYSYGHERNVIASFGTGTSTYFGELQNPKHYIDYKPSFNLGLQVFPAPYFLLNRLSARAELTWFRLQGDDANANDDRVERNLSFFSNNVELNSVGILHLLPQDRLRFYKRAVFNVYGFVGIGLMYMNPKTKYNGEKIALQPLQTEGTKYSRLQFVIPYGIGVNFLCNAYFNVALEAGWRKTFTDHLDDASIVRYPDPLSLKSDLSRALSDRRRERDADYPIKPNLGRRGNPEKKDSYMLVNIKLEYYLPYVWKGQFRRSKRSGF